MKNLLCLFFSFFFSSLILTACLAQPPVSRVLRLDEKHVVILLDSAQAAAFIVQDAYDHYFEKVGFNEMTIQMKRMPEKETTRESFLPFYKEFLQTDVADFDEKEARFTVEVMEKSFKTASQIASDLFPDTLYLLKTKGRHYGNSVYYTRGKGIVIPANELAARKRDNFTTTMYHELFHVYSRLHPEKRRALYHLIGFETIGFDHLILPPELLKRVLFNPDGVDFAQKITLATPEGETIHAIPVIYANQPGYVRGQEEFFSYLEFNLYKIERAGDQVWSVVTAENGYSSTLQVDKLPDFFQQIKDNTGYIIHPDEVLADNFSFIMRQETNPQYTAKFSVAGRQLLKDMEGVLRQ